MIKLNDGHLHLELDYEESQKLVVEILKDSLNLVEYFIEDAFLNGEIDETMMADLQDNFRYKVALETVMEYFDA